MDSLSRMSASWQCPDCGEKLEGWTYAHLVEKGGPVCSNCDCDMEVIPKSGTIDLTE